MKRVLPFLLTYIVSLMSVSCVDEISDSSLLMQEMTFSATIQSETRTMLTESNGVSWLPGDQIAVNAANEPFTADIEEPSDFTLFTGSAYQAANYYAVYPYSLFRVFDDSMAIIEMPHIQKAVKGGFADDLNISVARASSDEMSFRFRNVLGYVKFTISEESDPIKSVTVRTIGKEPLAGVIKVDCSSDYPSAILHDNSQYSVTLVSETVLEPGNYYIGLVPGRYASGLEFSFRNEEGLVAIKQISREISLNDGQIRNIGEVKDLEFGESVETKQAMEREALIAIYDALDGDNWPNNENWCSEKPVKEWYGVETDENSFVTKLHICGNLNKLAERVTLPTEIGCLKNLSSLWLEMTNVDSFPDVIASLDIEVFRSWQNPYLTLSEYKPIYDGAGTLKEFEVVLSTDLGYEISDQFNIPQPIPSELLKNKGLKTLCLEGCNLSGNIPSWIGELTALESLILYNLWTTNMTGEIPSTIGNLKNLRGLRLFNLELSGGIPEELYAMPQLVSLEIDSCNIGGTLSPAIGNLINLERLNLRDAGLTGELPVELANIMDNLYSCMLDGNNLSGQIPEEIRKHPKWRQFWTSIIDRNQFNVTYKDIPSPSFSEMDVFGNLIQSDVEYENNTYTIIYQYDVAMFPFISSAVYPCNKMYALYEAYNKFGVEILMFNGVGWENEVREFILENDIPWPVLCYPPFGMAAIPNVTIVDKNKEVVFSTILDDEITPFSDILAFFEEKFPDEKYSTSDYSQDGKVSTLQTASEGEGINIVLMGDAYSDRQIADGTYEADMRFMYENLFDEEPFKSYKEMFNVYYVNVVSATEGYLYEDTSLGTYFGGGTSVGGNDQKCFEYALKALTAEDMSEALVIVAMNSDAYAGTCYMYYPELTSGTYGTGTSVAYFPKGKDLETFLQLLHHEACGHGFAKLADEYAYEYMGAVPDDYANQTIRQQNEWGWWKNVDFTSDPSQVRWSHFLEDERYQYDGLGCFEGGLTYWSGVWRPTEDSIMRYNIGGFNAPSREAIWYRIHKLAYGDSWEYDYEDFVEWDAINRASSASAARRQRANYVERTFEPTAPPVIVGKSWRDAK